MRCASAHDLLESYLDGELDPRLKAEIEDHLAGCSSCTETHSRLRELQTDIRAQAPYYNAPADLQQRVREALGQSAKNESAAQRPPYWQWMAIAASLLLAVSLAWNVSLFRSRGEVMAQNVLSSHVRSLIGTHLLDVPSSDRHTVKPWFNGRLDFAPDVKDLASQGFPLVGGRIEYIAGHPAAALVYQRRQHVINLFTWPSESAGNSVGALDRQGFHLLQWNNGGMTYWAVSDLNLTELQQFANLYQARP
jgi:anti-sigma factor RsiW